MSSSRGNDSPSQDNTANLDRDSRRVIYRRHNRIASRQANRQNNTRSRSPAEEVCNARAISFADTDEVTNDVDTLGPTETAEYADTAESPETPEYTDSVVSIETTEYTDITDAIEAVMYDYETAELAYWSYVGENLSQLQSPISGNISPEISEAVEAALDILCSPDNFDIPRSHHLSSTPLNNAVKNESEVVTNDSDMYRPETTIDSGFESDTTISNDSYLPTPGHSYGTVNRWRYETCNWDEDTDTEDRVEN